MKLWLWFLFLLAGGAEIRDVLKSAEIDRIFAGIVPSRSPARLAVHEAPNYAIALEVQSGRPGPYELHRGADEVLFVRKGTARIILGGQLTGEKEARPDELVGSGITTGNRHEMGAGDVIHIPRNTPHQIDPGAGRLEYAVVRVFPAGDKLPPRKGFLSSRQMPDVLKKSEIDATFSKFNSNQPLHSAPNFTINYVIYSDRSGPWEAHRGCVDIYFLQTGTATAELGGEIADPKEESPGEIRGAGVSGARRYQIGPGDIVVIPRNTAHHVSPLTGKVGYLLLKVWAE